MKYRCSDYNATFCSHTFMALSLSSAKLIKSVKYFIRTSLSVLVKAAATRKGVRWRCVCVIVRLHPPCARTLLSTRAETGLMKKLCCAAI